jgi:hypothetical protein
MRSGRNGGTRLRHLAGAEAPRLCKSIDATGPRPTSMLRTLGKPHRMASPSHHRSDRPCRSACPRPGNVAKRVTSLTAPAGRGCLASGPRSALFPGPQSVPSLCPRAPPLAGAGLGQYRPRRRLPLYDAKSQRAFHCLAGIHHHESQSYRATERKSAPPANTLTMSFSQSGRATCAKKPQPIPILSRSGNQMCPNDVRSSTRERSVTSAGNVDKCRGCVRAGGRVPNLA